MTLNRISLLLLLGALGACRKEPKPVPLTATEVEQRTQTARHELEELRPQFAALREKFTALHREFDPLPPGLPSFGETRGKFYATDIGLGTLSAKLPWLEGRIQMANASKSAAEFREISREIAHTKDELRQVDLIALELTHEVQPFKHATEEKLQLQAIGKNTCE